MRQYTTNLEWIKQLFVGIEYEENDGFNSSKYVNSEGFHKNYSRDDEKGLLDLPEDILLLLIQYLSPKDLIR